MPTVGRVARRNCRAFRLVSRGRNANIFWLQEIDAGVAAYSVSLVNPSEALESAAMADPRTELSAQELIYAATALRAEATVEAADPQLESCRALFEQSSACFDALVGKFTRVAEAIGWRGNWAGG